MTTFERAIALDPWQADAYHGAASSRRFAHADRPWISALLSRLAAGGWSRRCTPTIAARRRMLLHFAAGKVFDDIGQYDDALEHFHAANTIRQRLCPFDRDDVERTADLVVDQFTREFIHEHAGMGCGDETPVLIVGMPRSGTTLLERIISSHPWVRGGGELTFWSEHGPMFASASPEDAAKTAEWLRTNYLRTLRRTTPAAARATDKTPFNFFWVGLVHLLFPRARIVHARRSAEDTCLSIYTTPFPLNWGFTSTPRDLASYYRVYLRLMKQWRSVIAPERLLDIDYEELVAEPEKIARRLIAFIGLEWDSACLRPESNGDPVRTASSWQARQPIYRTSVERWRNYETWVEELRALL